MFGGAGRAAAGTPAGRDQDLRLAAAALLVEAAEAADGFAAEERAAIRRVLAQRFTLDAAAAERLLEEGRRASERSVQLFGFTRTVNERASPEEREALIEMLWEVVLADGRLDP